MGGVDSRWRVDDSGSKENKNCLTKAVETDIIKLQEGIPLDGCVPLIAEITATFGDEGGYFFTAIM